MARWHTVRSSLDVSRRSAQAFRTKTVFKMTPVGSNKLRQSRNVAQFPAQKPPPTDMAIILARHEGLQTVSLGI